MPALHIHVLAVYSQLYPETGVMNAASTVGDMRLLTHQVDTLAAFDDSAVDVIINTAMTGDGKSLAAYLAALRDGMGVVAMYPTNELILDQYAALPRYSQQLRVRLPACDTMYSEKITQLMRVHDTAIRLEEVRKLLVRNRMLLTNPDLLHLMMSHQYGWGHLRKELPVTVGSYFDYFLFDEFHVFSVPQVIAVMNMLGYLMTGYRDKPNERKKFLFLSATPNPLLSQFLERGGLRVKSMSGSYRSSAQKDYRCILQPCELGLHEISQERPTEVWVEEQLEEIHGFFQKYAGSKAAILVSSVATARRLYARLKAYFEPQGITVGENTGLTSREEREASRKKDILVGTSTVDVGVDFHINYLIFEAFTAGSFLQRFGRLGRHDEFMAYQAHALMPRFVLERLQEHMQAEMERETLNEMIRSAFPGEQTFANYSRVWGVVQAAQIVVELQSQRKKDENAAFTEALIEQYERTYGTPDKPVMERARKKYLAMTYKAPQIAEELRSFRGQSPLSCGVWDSDNELKTYDLFFLLANTEFEVMDKFPFMQEVRRRKLEEREFEEQLLYLNIHAYVPERLQMVLGVSYDVTAYLHTIQVLHGFTVREPHTTWNDRVNQRLKRLKLPAIVSDMPRFELKQRLRLGGLFPVYRLQDVTGNEYSVIFGQEALLLDSLLFAYKTKGDRALFL